MHTCCVASAAPLCIGALTMLRTTAGVRTGEVLAATKGNLKFVELCFDLICQSISTHEQRSLLLGVAAGQHAVNGEHLAHMCAALSSALLCQKQKIPIFNTPAKFHVGPASAAEQTSTFSKE